MKSVNHKIEALTAVGSSALLALRDLVQRVKELTVNSIRLTINPVVRQRECVVKPVYETQIFRHVGGCEGAGGQEKLIGDAGCSIAMARDELAKLRKRAPKCHPEICPDTQALEAGEDISGPGG